MKLVVTSPFTDLVDGEVYFVNEVITRQDKRAKELIEKGVVAPFEDEKPARKSRKKE